MSSGPTYRLVAVRDDGRRDIIATSLTDETAALMRQLIEAEMPMTQLVVELEQANLRSDS